MEKVPPGLEEVHNEKDDDVMEPPAWRWIAAFLPRKNLFFSSEEIFPSRCHECTLDKWKLFSFFSTYY